MIDCHSRRLAGWAVADHMRTDLIVDALSAARDPRGLAGRGDLPQRSRAQYTLEGLRPALRRARVTQSMGAVGTSADNALAESFNATLKRETLHGAPCWPDVATCRREVFRWVTRYNTRRRHSWCGQQAPNIYERQQAATLRLAA